MRKRRCRRKKRFCQNMRAAVCDVARAVRHLRRARELTSRVWVEEELTDEIATLREVCRRLVKLRRRRCARSVCRCF